MSANFGSSPQPHRYQTALSIVALVLVVLMAIVAVLVQQSLRQSQDLRQQASTVLPSPSPAVCNTSGDLTNDGTVTTADFNLFMQYFLKSSPSRVGDLNCDGITDFTDYSLLSRKIRQISK
jgi:hypothetical protein